MPAKLATNLPKPHSCSQDDLSKSEKWAFHLATIQCHSATTLGLRLSRLRLDNKLSKHFGTETFKRTILAENKAAEIFREFFTEKFLAKTTERC